MSVNKIAQKMFLFGGKIAPDIKFLPFLLTQSWVVHLFFKKFLFDLEKRENSEGKVEDVTRSYVWMAENNS